MKTIGLIGGSTWVSTADYYKIINQLTFQLLGGSHSARILMYSLNFHEFRIMIENGRFDDAENYLCNIALNLEQGGADCLVICANTPHMFAQAIQSKIQIPLIHIVKETSAEIEKLALKKVGLLGTKPTMEKDFYKDLLLESGIQTIIPAETDRNFIHETIFNEFSKEIFLPETKQRYLTIINKMIDDGAEGIILGCTEIPLLIKPSDCNVPVFDTMYIHAKAAVAYANK